MLVGPLDGQSKEDVNNFTVTENPDYADEIGEPGADGEPDMSAVVSDDREDSEESNLEIDLSLVKSEPVDVDDSL